MSRITIIGAGFGGVTAARQLCKRLPEAEITRVAPEPELIFYASLIWIPSGLRHGDDLRVPLAGFFEQHGIRFHRDRVNGLRHGGRTVVTDSGEISNDGLVIASGANSWTSPPGPGM